MVNQSGQSSTSRSHPYRRQDSGRSGGRESLLATRGEWEAAKCRICFDPPLNAVSLICTSFHTGCRVFMCWTCFKKFKTENTEMTCPRCSGQVTDYSVNFVAQAHLNNTKIRFCKYRYCLFLGIYRHLKRHVKKEHGGRWLWPRPAISAEALYEEWKELQKHKDVRRG
uniref:RING-type domain-containing protein n=1 Tax=Lactuca sativa TaxID=4236 RepID=A0A9R1VGL3_LACSA|nr:hypothetical protein LSAT_V11C500263110 [Lactuca sativa]